MQYLIITLSSLRSNKNTKQLCMTVLEFVSFQNNTTLSLYLPNRLDYHLLYTPLESEHLKDVCLLLDQSFVFVKSYILDHRLFHPVHHYVFFYHSNGYCQSKSLNCLNDKSYDKQKGYKKCVY